MDWSLNINDTDRTEDAAVLLRRLLDIYARVAFVAAASPDKDVNALRCELSAARELEKAMRDLIEASSDETHTERHQEWLDRIEEIEEALVSKTGEAKQALSTTDIFKRIGHGYLLLWRQTSDVLHAGLIGRSLQIDGTTVGVPATSERRQFVMDTSIAVMADTARCWAKVLGRDLAEIERFEDEHNARIGATVDDAGHS